MSKKRLLWITGVGAVLLTVLIIRSTAPRSTEPRTRSKEDIRKVEEPRLDQALRQITSMDAEIRKRSPKGPWKGTLYDVFENVYGGGAYAAGRGDHYVIYFPKVPHEDCVALATELIKRPGVGGVGIDGRSPGWRTKAGVAAEDCSDGVSQVNVMMR